MKNFVLYNSLETSHEISKENFEKYTKNNFPFKQTFGGTNHYYATCPDCENTIQLIGLYNGERTYGAHAGKYINGLNPYNYTNYIFCPRANPGYSRASKDTRKDELTSKDIAIYNMVRENFDLAVEFAKKYLGYYISNDKAKECLEIYYNSKGWLYPYSTTNNIPFMIFYLQQAINPYGLLIRKNSSLEKAVLHIKELKLEPVINPKLGKYYNKLLVNSKHFISLNMLLWHHKFQENNEGSLDESIDIEINKNISLDPTINDWKTVLNIKINIPESEFVKFTKSTKTYRNKDLQEFALKLMPELS